MTQQKLTKEQEEKLDEISRLSELTEQKMRSAGGILNQLERKLDQKLGKQSTQQAE